MPMTVAQLKKLIENAPDDAILLAPGSDHSLRTVHATIGTALQESRTDWTEDHGEAVTPRS